MVSQKEKDNINGKMDLFISVNLKMGLNMEKVSGRVVKDPSVTSMKEIMHLIRNMGMEYSSGHLVTHIRGNTRKMKETGMEK